MFDLIGLIHDVQAAFVVSAGALESLSTMYCQVLKVARCCLLRVCEMIALVNMAHSCQILRHGEVLEECASVKQEEV